MNIDKLFLDKEYKRRTFKTPEGKIGTELIYNKAK